MLRQERKIKREQFPNALPTAAPAVVIRPRRGRKLGIYGEGYGNTKQVRRIEAQQEVNKQLGKIRKCVGYSMKLKPSAFCLFIFSPLRNKNAFTQKTWSTKPQRSNWKRKQRRIIHLPPSKRKAFTRKKRFPKERKMKRSSWKVHFQVKNCTFTVHISLRHRTAITLQQWSIRFKSSIWKWNKLRFYSSLPIPHKDHFFDEKKKIVSGLSLYRT